MQLVHARNSYARVSRPNISFEGDSTGPEVSPALICRACPGIVRPLRSDSISRNRPKRHRLFKLAAHWPAIPAHFPQPTGSPMNDLAVCAAMFSDTPGTHSNVRTILYVLYISRRSKFTRSI